MTEVRIEVRKRMANHAVGEIVIIAADNNGTPLDKFWRRRLEDAEHDDCCKIVRPAPKAAPVLRKSEPVSDDEGEK